MKRKKTPRQQWIDDRRSEARLGQPPVEPLADGGNVLWKELLSFPDRGPAEHANFAGRTFSSLIVEIMDLRAQVREGRQALRRLQQQILKL